MYQDDYKCVLNCEHASKGWVNENKGRVKRKKLTKTASVNISINYS